MDEVHSVHTQAKKQLLGLDIVIHRKQWCGCNRLPSPATHWWYKHVCSQTNVINVIKSYMLLGISFKIKLPRQPLIQLTLVHDAPRISLFYNRLFDFTVQPDLSGGALVLHTRSLLSATIT